jgi:hypothetical protein
VQFVPLFFFIDLAEIFVQTEERGSRSGGSDKLVDDRGTSQRVDEQVEFVLEMGVGGEVSKESVLLYS